MEQLLYKMRNEVERIAVLTESDFSVLGWLDPIERRLYWQLAYGSISGRTLQMAHRAHAGLIGSAVRSGRPAVLDSGTDENVRIRNGEPIMLAEGLLVAAAFPLERKSATSGILLIGRRTERSYSKEDIVKTVAEIAVSLELVDELHQKKLLL